MPGKVPAGRALRSKGRAGRRMIPDGRGSERFGAQGSKLADCNLGKVVRFAHLWAPGRAAGPTLELTGDVGNGGQCRR